MPQTALAEGQGRITLTNAMFGVVDVDTPTSQVTISLQSRPAEDSGADARTDIAYVGADGQVRIDGRAAGIIEVSDDGINWNGAGSFTLKQLDDGHVRFTQDVRFEFGDNVDPHINLLIAACRCHRRRDPVHPSGGGPQRQRGASRPADCQA